MKKGLEQMLTQQHSREGSEATCYVSKSRSFFLGLRQLVCLARVLLKKRRILLLDEATASIGTATDNVIQETIREEMKECTVNTVAHRIPAVVDNDLVLVLDQGKIVQYDSPAGLIQDSSSAFSKLVAEFLRRSSTSRMTTNY